MRTVRADRLTVATAQGGVQNGTVLGGRQRAVNQNRDRVPNERARGSSRWIDSTSSGRDWPPNDPPTALRTTAGDVPLHEFRAALGGRMYHILHTGAVLTFLEEQILLSERESRLPYGVALWPGAIALTHEIAARAEQMRGSRVLELGAGTGLPGIVAASLGAHVVQTDRQQAALALCRFNAERNGVTSAEHRLADWTAWTDDGHYDWIIGSDVIYSAGMHPHLTRIFDSNLATGGRVLLSDPFRKSSLALLESLESSGWTVVVNRWSVGPESEPGSLGVFELSRPMSGKAGYLRTPG